jgi:hypothetical protein
MHLCKEGTSDCAVPSTAFPSVVASDDALSADDAHILNLESDSITGHTLKLVILEPGTGPLDLDTLRSAVEQRLATQPRATQRVDTAGGDPRWVVAGAFDITDHIRRVSTPDAASEADLWRIVSGLTTEP